MYYVLGIDPIKISIMKYKEICLKGNIDSTLYSVHYNVYTVHSEYIVCTEV